MISHPISSRVNFFISLNFVPFIDFTPFYALASVTVYITTYYSYLMIFLFYHHTLLCSFLLTSILLCVRSLFSSVSSITQVPGDVTENGNYSLSSHPALLFLTYFFPVFSCVCFSCSPHHHISQVLGDVIRSGNNIWDCERSGEWVARRHQWGTETPLLARSLARRPTKENVERRVQFWIPPLVFRRVPL